MEQKKVTERKMLSLSDWIGLAGIFVSTLLAIIALFQAYTNSQQDITIKNFSFLLENSQRQIQRLTELNALQSRALGVMDSNLTVTRDIQTENISRTKFETGKEKTDLINLFKEIDIRQYTLLKLLTSWKTEDERESLLNEIKQFRKLLKEGLSNRYLLANEPLALTWEKLDTDFYLHSLSLKSLDNLASLQADNVDVPEYETSLKEELTDDSKTFKKLLIATKDYINRQQKK